MEKNLWKRDRVKREQSRNENQPLYGILFEKIKPTRIFCSQNECPHPVTIQSGPKKSMQVTYLH